MQLFLEPDVSPVAITDSTVFGAGSRTMPIWLDEVDCSGSEATLVQCPHFQFGVEDCDHFEDAAVDCSPMVPTTEAITDSELGTTEAATTVAATTEEAVITTPTPTCKRL